MYSICMSFFVCIIHNVFQMHVRSRCMQIYSMLHIYLLSICLSIHISIYPHNTFTWWCLHRQDESLMIWAFWWWANPVRSQEQKDVHSHCPIKRDTFWHNFCTFNRSYMVSLWVSMCCSSTSQSTHLFVHHSLHSLQASSSLATSGVTTRFFFTPSPLWFCWT